MSELQKIRDENHVLHCKIKHTKELIDLKNPANANKNDEGSKNFDQSSMKSGGQLSFAGSVINEVNKNPGIFGALSSLDHGSSPGLQNQLSFARVSSIFIHDS